MPTATLEPESGFAKEDRPEPHRWLVFEYVPLALFSLKSSRATSTAGKTLLTPTPYSVKMAFLDAALRNGFAEDAEALVRCLAGATARIGVPAHACVTGTIQSIRQEVRGEERRRNPEMPAYRASIALREFVHYQGTLRVAFDLRTCPPEFAALLQYAAPAINYFGKRGSFVQYLDCVRRLTLDATFTEPARSDGPPARGQRAALDDFGARATFAALNSFSADKARRDVDRRFVETIIPLRVYNAGPVFVHYSRTL